MKKVAVYLWIDEDEDPRVEDAVSEILSDQLKSRVPTSALLDWEYVGGEYNGVDKALETGRC